MQETYGFFAMMARLKWIDRWALMRNSSDENLASHSLDVAMLAHALCVIGNERLGKNLNADRAAVIGMYHDVSEILTGDMPTPVKYFNREIRSAYKDVERDANMRLLALLPQDLRAQFTHVLEPGEEYAREKRLAKGADKLSAYIKCIEERKAGNNEFLSAEAQTRRWLEETPLPEVAYYMEHFIPAFELTLDELGTIEE